MKSKLYIALIIIDLLLGSQVFAQIKIHSDNHISLGSLSKDHGLQIQPNGYTYFAPSNYVPYGWMNLTYATNAFSKSYIIDFNQTHTFFVYGNGQIYSQALWMNADSSTSINITPVDNALLKVMQLRGVFYKSTLNRNVEDTGNYVDKYGYYYETHEPSIFPDTDNVYINQKVRGNLISETDLRFIGLIAQEVERVIPELVRTMPDGNKAISYESIIGIVIEAIKQQQSEIELLKNELSSYLESSERNQIIKGLNRGFCADSSVTNIEHENRLYQNAPNPFTESTTISWTMGFGHKSVAILIFDIEGNFIKMFNLDPTESKLIISSKELEAGLYFYSLIIDGKEIDTKRMMLIR